jgi:hypothetical protein
MAVPHIGLFRIISPPGLQWTHQLKNPGEPSTTTSVPTPTQWRLHSPQEHIGSIRVLQHGGDPRNTWQPFPLSLRSILEWLRFHGRRTISSAETRLSAQLRAVLVMVLRVLKLRCSLMRDPAHRPPRARCNQVPLPSLQALLLPKPAVSRQWELAT